MMVEENPAPSQDDTREKLLAAAQNQFAERGFYGASIAQIAGEVGLTKQALLYHFKRKEDLYSEVLKRIATRLQTNMQAHINSASSPAEQFSEMMLGMYRAARKNPLDTKVLMRELLDNQRRDAPPEEWHFKRFLDRLVEMLDRIDGMAEHPSAEKFARIYQVVSAIEFFAASGALLERFYGEEEYARIAEAYPEELQAQLRRLLSNGKS